MSGKKVTFHIPDEDMNIYTALEAVAEQTGLSPSQIVYRIVSKKMRESGVLTEDGKLNKKVIKPITDFKRAAQP